MGNGNNGAELEFKVYLEERRQLEDAVRESSNLFDKAILTLSGGAFGLSLTFIRQIAPTVKQETIYMLIIAWTCFCISMLSTLISFLTSKSACRKQIEILENQYFGHEELPSKENKLSQFTTFLNITSITCFILGTIWLTVYCIKNLAK